MIYGCHCSQTWSRRRMQVDIYHKQESPLCTDAKSCGIFKLKHSLPALFPVPSIILMDKYFKDSLVARNIKWNLSKGFRGSWKIQEWEVNPDLKTIYVLTKLPKARWMFNKLWSSKWMNRWVEEGTGKYSEETAAPTDSRFGSVVLHLCLPMSASFVFFCTNMYACSTVAPL